ncbi:type-F conjugative transfer system secretin TraK [Pseudomonas sp. 18175]|uniref:type-F conjugative transfer system secretin TraK n=1 Tax=Pseudomonas sp. 18175 TaxID=3390056 RepID=UPI003D1D3C8B
MRVRNRWLTAASLLLLPTAGDAEQRINARDGVAVEAILSRREPTRIRIENAPITDVFGSVYASNCVAPASEPLMPGAPDPSRLPLNPEGEVLLECDRSKGEVYIKPVGARDKPVNLFIASAQATYTLILRPADTPADTIVIRDISPSSGTHQSGPISPATAHVRALKTLLTAIAADRALSGFEVETLDQPLQLWREAQLTLVRRYTGATLIGERYLLRNISEQEMVLAEQEFDRSSDAVLAVAIDQHNLLPGASGTVYVLRQAEVQP